MSKMSFSLVKSLWLKILWYFFFGKIIVNGILNIDFITLFLDIYI